MPRFFVAQFAHPPATVRNTVGPNQTLVVHDVPNAAAGAALIPRIAADPVRLLQNEDGHTKVHRTFTACPDYAINGSEYDATGAQLPQPGPPAPPAPGSVRDLLTRYPGDVVVLLRHP